MSNTQSIRTLVLVALINGVDRKTIAAQLQEKFPESAAAKKSTVHIAWYAGWLKRKATPAQRAKLEALASVTKGHEFTTLWEGLAEAE